MYNYLLVLNILYALNGNINGGFVARSQISNVPFFREKHLRLTKTLEQNWLLKCGYVVCPFLYSVLRTLLGMAIKGLWSFLSGGTKLERFLPKNQHTQRKLLNFENWVSGEVSKSAKSPNLLTFKVNFVYQKLSESFSIFFSLKDINLGAHFLLLRFFDKIIF